MTTYRRRPTTIEAIQYLDAESYEAIIAMGATLSVWNPTFVPGKGDAVILAGKGGAQGNVILPLGHWVAKADDDDFYPIDPDVFAATYISDTAI